MQLHVNLRNVKVAIATCRLNVSALKSILKIRRCQTDIPAVRQMVLKFMIRKMLVASIRTLYLIQVSMLFKMPNPFFIYELLPKKHTYLDKI